MCKLIIMSVVGFFGLLLVINPTYACDPYYPPDYYEQLRAITIPASACQLRDPRDGPKVYMSNGAWRFRGSQIGTVHFYCPFPVNALPLAGAGPNHLKSFRVWYHDPDGKGRDQRVAARLYIRESANIYTKEVKLSTVGKTFDSNTYDVKSARYQQHETQYNQGLNLRYPAIYHFGVTMVRNNTFSSPGLIGIDFNDTLEEDVIYPDDCQNQNQNLTAFLK